MASLNKVIVADLTILGGAFFFGIGFLGQRAVSVHGLGPMTCNTMRFGLSTIMLVALLPILPTDGPIDGEPMVLREEGEFLLEEEGGGSGGGGAKSRESGGGSGSTNDKSETKLVIARLFGPLAAKFLMWRNTVWFWGIFLGFINFGASGFQQWGITQTSASKCAFIAGFDLFLTPIFSLFIPTFKANAKPTTSVWIAVGIAFFGLFMLSGATYDDFEMSAGDTLTLISTVFWTLHITYTDIATSHVDTMSMMCVQLGFVTFLSACAALYFEPQQWLWDHIFFFWPWLLFLAISEGLGFTLMALGQNTSPPTHAAIILSLEGVFAAISSYFIIGETLTLREMFGCLLMLIATLMAEIGLPCLKNESRHLIAATSAAGASSNLEMTPAKGNGVVIPPGKVSVISTTGGVVTHRGTSSANVIPSPVARSSSNNSSSSSGSSTNLSSNSLSINLSAIFNRAWLTTVLGGLASFFNPDILRNTINGTSSSSSNNNNNGISSRSASPGGPDAGIPLLVDDDLSGSGSNNNNDNNNNGGANGLSYSNKINVVAV